MRDYSYGDGWMWPPTKRGMPLEESRGKGKSKLTSRLIISPGQSLLLMLAVVLLQMVLLSLGQRSKLNDSRLRIWGFGTERRRSRRCGFSRWCFLFNLCKPPMDTCRSAVGMELVIAFVQLISSSHACTLSLVKPYQDFYLPLSGNPLSITTSLSLFN